MTGNAPSVPPAYTEPVYVSTERLVLRRLRQTDVDAAHAILSDPACAAYFDGTPATWTDTVDLVERAANVEPVEEVAVCIRGSGELIGIVRSGPFIHGEDEFGGRELRWVIHRDYWSKGVATEAGRTLIEEVFIDPAVSHVVAFCEREHLRARKVAEKLGMVEEKAVSAGPMPVAAEVFGTTNLELREIEVQDRTISPTLVRYVFMRPGARRTFQPT